MEDKLELEILDVPWNLIGSRRVIINTTNTNFKEGDFIKILNNDNVTVAKIYKIENSEENSIRLDRNLRENISAKIGDTLLIEKLDRIENADFVQISIPKDVQISQESLKELLKNFVTCVGNGETILEEGITFYVSQAKPSGIVKVVDSTDIKLNRVREIEQETKQQNKDMDILAETPNISFADIGGLDDVKELLKENIVYPITKSEAYKKVGYTPLKGLLLYGQPGTGKTILAKASAKESGAKFIFIPSSKLKDKYFGESEKKIREAFTTAKMNTPCIIFFDEIDAVGHERTEHRINIVNQLLSLIDEMPENVFFIGATNLIHEIDPALIRPGRLNKVEIPLPDKKTREMIFKIHTQGIEITDEEISQIALTAEGYTGAKIEQVCNNARIIALRETDYSGETKPNVNHVKMAMGSELDKGPTHMYA